MKLRVLSGVAICLALLALAASPAAAQTVSGRIVGTVHDSSGAVLPGATVVLNQPGTGFQQTQTTNETGDYAFTFVPPGDYVVTATMMGFKGVKRPVTLQAQGTVRADFTMAVGELNEDVVVQAPVSVVRTENAELGEVITQTQIAAVPLNGRRFADLVLLNAGAGISTSGTSDTPLLQTGPNLNINGTRSTHNSYSIDGVTATDYYFSNLSASTSVDAIQEFRIASGQYGAEFGGKGGGHVHVVTRSGSNDLHGTAFEFFRDESLDARNYFASKDADKPPFRQDQFGGSLGGPIVRNRLFFFANYEGLRTRETITKLSTVPTAAMRAGDFSGLNTIYDPSTTAANGTRSAFPNNRIPAERLNAAALVLLETVPLPNLAGVSNNFLGQGARSRNDDQVNLRLDYGTSRGNRLFGRFSLNEIDALEPFGSRGTNSLPGFASNVTTGSRNAALSYTHLLSQRHVMNVLLGLNRVSGGIDTTNQELDIARRAGLQVIQDGPDELRGAPVINTTFTSAFGDDTSTLLRTNTTYQAALQFHLTAAGHNLMYGFEVMRHHFEPYTAIFARGSYTYSGRYTASTSTGTNGNGFADFMLGIPFSGTALSGNAIERARSTWWGFYVQDNWRLSPRLTVNLGVRYDIMPPFYDKDNRLAAIDLDGQRVIVSSSDGQIGEGADPNKYARGYPLPFVSSEQAGWPRSLVDTDWTNIGPRLGLAYSVKPSLVLRGGYSTTYSVPPLNLQARMDRNPPFSGLLSPTNTVAPSFTTETAFADAQSPPSFGFLLRDFRNTRIQQWSAGFDKELGLLGLWVAYVGTKTDFLDWFGTGNPASACVAPCAPLEQRRVYPGLGGFTVSSNDARARYDALQIRVDQRPWNGLRSVTSFTWSESRDNASSSSGDDNSVTNDPFDLDADWGPSSFDRRAAFVLSYGYKLPFGPGERWLKEGPAAAVLGDWELSGVITAKSGDHFSVSIATCPSNSGGSCRTDMTGDPNLSSGDRTPTRWFDTSVFRPSSPGTFGNQPRNEVVGPGYLSWDFMAHKNISLARSHQLQVRIEVFNLTNRANFAKPDSRFGAASFGAISSAGPARQMQLGLKYTF